MARSIERTIRPSERSREATSAASVAAWVPRSKRPVASRACQDHVAVSFMVSRGGGREHLLDRGHALGHFSQAVDSHRFESFAPSNLGELSVRCPRSNGITDRVIGCEQFKQADSTAESCTTTSLTSFASLEDVDGRDRFYHPSHTVLDLDLPTALGTDAANQSLRQHATKNRCDKE